MRRFNLLIS